MKTTKLLFLILFILLFTNSVFADVPDEYSPYPIIFVHGYNAKEPKSWDAWKTAKSNIQVYFKEDGEYKYSALDDKEKYFPTVNYGEKKTGIISRNGSNPAIAIFVLAPKIDDAIKGSFPASYPESERKIIIVAHSMGGLAIRTLLYLDATIGLRGHAKGYYASKIDRVVFVDTPHLGSPYASAVWMIDKEAKEILPSLIDENTTFFSKDVGVLRSLAASLQPDCWVYNHISRELQKRLERDEKVLRIIENRGTDPDGFAIDELRLPFHSEYHDKVRGRYGLWYKTVPIDIVYEADETFLGSYNLPNPSDFKIIRGDGTYPIISIGTASGFLFWYREGSPLGFNFKPGYTLADTTATGDDIVPKLSQEGIGGTDYVVNTWHGAARENWQTILKAIDDKPEIEKVSTVASYEYYPWPPHGEKISYNYVKVKLKDYLLADIEIVEMIVNDNPVDLSSFLDPETNTYKPYYKYKDKDFLKERTDTTAPFYPNDSNTVASYLTLEPGEFWVRIDAPQVYNVFLKIKNPAEKESSREVCFPHDKVYGVYRNAGAMGLSSEGWSWDSVKEAAYSSLLAAEKLVIEREELGYSTAPIGCWGVSQHLFETYTDEDGNTTTENLFRVGIGWCYSQWVAFKLNTLPQDIESIKLCLFIKGSPYSPYKDEFGDVLFYHNTSNSWPPVSSSSADKLLLSCSCETTDYIEIDIDPQDISADGYYIVEYKPAFQEYNCIPTPLSSDDKGYECVRMCYVGPYRLEVELKEDEEQ